MPHILVYLRLEDISSDVNGGGVTGRVAQVEEDDDAATPVHDTESNFGETASE